VVVRSFSWWGPSLRTKKSRPTAITIMRLPAKHTVNQPVDESFSRYAISILRAAMRTALPPHNRG